MKVLMISTDSRIIDPKSREYARMKSYATVTEELHIIVFTKSGTGINNTQEGNLFIYPTNSWNRWFYGFNANSIAMGLKKRGITLITAQDPFETGLIALKIAHSLKVPIQVQLHTDFLSPHYAAESPKNKIRVGIADRIFPKANCIRVVSERLKKGLIERYGLKKDPMVLPIHLDIPVSLLAGRRDLLKSKYPQFAKIMVMISRLEPEKNVYMAINAFYNISKHHPGVGLVIIGDGSTRAQLEKAVEGVELNQEVIFADWQNDVIPYFLSADLFLNTSNYEGYGRTLIEAAAAGCPIVTTDVGIVGEVLNSDNVLVSQPQDLEGFQRNLEYALFNPQEMASRAARAREAITHYMSFTENDRLEMFRRSWSECSQ